MGGFFLNPRVGWWKGMKQFLPTKSAEHEETPVRYSSSEISHLRPREVPTMLQTESAGTFYWFCGPKKSGIWLHLITDEKLIVLLVRAFLKMQAFSNLFSEYHKSMY